jgi:chromosome partitioning protein
VRTLGIGGGKGGTGKTMAAVTLATIGAERWPGGVLLVDGDENRTASDWAARAARTGPGLPFDVAAGHDPAELSRLRNVGTQYQLVIVDLPGARKTGELRAILRPEHSRRAAVDALLIPTQPSPFDIPVIVRTIREDVIPSRVPYRVVLSIVPAVSMGYAEGIRDDLRAEGIEVTDALIRRYTAYLEATAAGVTIVKYGGKHDFARKGEEDYRQLASATFGGLLGMEWEG